MQGWMSKANCAVKAAAKAAAQANRIKAADHGISKSFFTFAQ
jgi:hypothetical protein